MCAAVAVLAGCRPGTALHNRYNNFRAYYNTYYNASRSLEEGEATVQATDQRVDLSRLVELFPSGAAAAGGTRNPAFQAAIDKSAELLRGRPSSAWADDALLVIGKAYFYQRNFFGAEQKFRETMAAALLHDDQRLADEARFWLGRTLAAAGRYDDGVGVLQDGLAADGGDRRWRARMALALAELYAWAGRWDDAAPALRDGLADIRDADLAARGFLLLGQVEEAAGRFDAAAEAYAQAAARRPVYEISYAALLSEALVLGLDAGRADEAMVRLRAMRRDDKHYARRAEVALAQARVMARAGDAAGAEALFRDVLYDETLAGQMVRGAAHARLAEFYRDVREDYILAAAHFDTAATALPAEPTAADRPSREAILGVSRQSTAFGGVAATTRRLAEIDSLLTLGSLSDEAFAARIAAIEAARYQSWADEQRRLAAVRAAQEFGGSPTAAFGGPVGGGQTPVSDGAEPPGAAPGLPASAPGTVPGADAGFLSYRDPASLQNGVLSFQRIWGDRPLVPNWRRLAAVQAAGVASAIGGGPTGTETARPGGSGPAPLDVSVVPRTPAQQAVLVGERATLRYELGNAFFLTLARPDLARDAYQRILEETPDAEVAARARYALAELEAAAGNAQRAADLYTRVAAMDSVGTLGRAARARVEGREPERTTPEAGTDIDAAYAEARRLWTAGDPLAAARALVRQGDADPDAPGAARAFFAAAAAYAEWAAGDSLRLEAPMPDSLAPETLLPLAPLEATPSADQAPAVRTPLEVAPPQAEPASEPEREPDALARALQEAAAPDSTAGEPLAADAVTEDDSPVPDAAVNLPGDPTPTIFADTAGARTLASVDSLHQKGLTLEAYLVAFARRYPDSRYAEAANRLRTALQGTDADSAAVEGDGLEPDAPVAASPVDDPDGLRGQTPPDPGRAGVSWKIQTFASQEEAEAIAQTLRTSRYRVGVATDGALFYVLVGQFATIAEGEAVRSGLPPWAQTRSVLIPISGFTLVGAAPAGGPIPASPPAPVGATDD